MTYYTHLSTPAGTLMLAGIEGGLQRIAFWRGTELEATQAGWINDARPFSEAIRQLHAYFAGELREFDLPLRPAGTSFQQSVWRALLDIPYGATISYGELASRLGNPKASRAVGLANGANPIAIVVPCHRVIGSNGKLTGYGGGLSVKKLLLGIESGLGFTA